MKQSFGYIDPNTGRRIIVFNYATNAGGTREFLLSVDGEQIPFFIEPEDFDNVEISWTMEDREKLTREEFVNLIYSLKQEGYLSKEIGKRDQFLRSLHSMSRQDRRKAIRAYEKKNGGKFIFNHVG